MHFNLLLCAEKGSSSHCLLWDEFYDWYFKKDIIFALKQTVIIMCLHIVQVLFKVEQNMYNVYDVYNAYNVHGFSFPGLYIKNKFKTTSEEIQMTQ